MTEKQSRALAILWTVITVLWTVTTVLELTSENPGTVQLVLHILCVVFSAVAAAGHFINLKKLKAEKKEEE